jgi:organic hydroperoxide reductase OsmC/OhrA
MAQGRARVFDYAVSLDEAGTAASDRGGGPLAEDEEAWTPEHLLLTALARCTLTSLRYHARRAGHEVRARADARGMVTAREEDGRFAFVDLEVSCTVELDPGAPAGDVPELLAKAERDCFVGASLRLVPRYRWVVDGREVT